MRTALATLATLAFLVAGTARADVAPDPVATGGMAVIAVAVLALVIFAAVLAIRFLRRARAKAGDQR